MPPLLHPPTSGRAVVLALLASLAGCSPSISLYDATAYENATDLKAEAVLLMETATEPAGAHDDAIAGLRLRARQALEYERGRPDNEVTTRMWEILLDPEAALLESFLQRWEDGPLRPAFVAEATAQIAEAFDQIIGLESGKLQPEDVEVSLFPGLSL
ncbi:MAG: hypothetical protein AAF845_17385 [Bacteroidota bacterium]